MKIWNQGSPSWSGGNTATLTNVQAGSTIVMCAYGYRNPASGVWGNPVDSLGNPIVVATGADTGPGSGHPPVQSKAWVMHNATGGTHVWSGLPLLNPADGDGMLFIAEFHIDGAVSNSVVGLGIREISVTSAPWFSTGSVTMSSGANAGDLLIAFAFEEEAGTGMTFTSFTDPPVGWNSLGVQTQSVVNIAGEACWRTAPDATAQTVAWTWSITGAQDPTLFRGVIFAIHAP